MKRSLVILPASFSGPYSYGFASPMTVWRGDEKLFAVFVTDPNISIPPEGQELIIGHADTLNLVLERAGLTRTRPAPAVIPPPAPEPVVVVVVLPPPEPEVIPAPEPVIVFVPPVVVEPHRPPVKRTWFDRVKKFFK